MSTQTVIFLGGNGHAPIRLAGVRAELARLGQPFEVVELPYPKVESYDQLLQRLAEEISALALVRSIDLVYATGIGGLVGLSLRARGDILDVPMVLQGAVLWGLEHRWFPKIMRQPPMPRLLVSAFSNRLIQKRFAKRHLQSAPDAEWLSTFFEGYGDADAFEAWFRWLNSDLLRRLEREFRESPRHLDDIRFWWGEQDHVVGPAELRTTEAALETEFPLETFATWGHYPMIDDPTGWVREVQHVLETARQLH